MTLRARLTLFYTGAMAVLLVAYACGTFVLLRAYEYGILDVRLHEDVEQLEARLQKNADGTLGLRTGTGPVSEDSEPSCSGSAPSIARAASWRGSSRRRSTRDWS